MKLSFRLITEDDVKQLLSWQYAPPYDIYNFEGEVSECEIEYYLNPQFHFHVIVDNTDSIIAFCSFGMDGQVTGGDYSENALDIGLGVRPDLTNQGKGINYVQSVINFAIETFNPTALRVTIAEFNVRAQKVWQKIGFVKISKFQSHRNKIPFVIYIKRLR